MTKARDISRVRNQTLTHLVGSRAAGQVYTNSTGKNKLVRVSASVSAINGYITAYVFTHANPVVSADCVGFSSLPFTAGQVGLTFEVLPGEKYQINLANATISIWDETL